MDQLDIDTGVKLIDIGINLIDLGINLERYRDYLIDKRINLMIQISTG